MINIFFAKQKILQLILLIFSVSVMAQQPLQLQLEQRGEVIVSFDAKYLNDIPDVQSWSVDKVENDRAIVYLNKENYNKLLQLKIPFIPEIAPSKKLTVNMAHSIDDMKNWDAYPDYSTYLAMMQQLANDYPEICKLDTIGTSKDNRLLLALKISDNVSENENEPQVFYTSSMHGDELTGYVLMLRLADYILQVYSNPVKGDDAQIIKDIVENIELYINPLANPDGAFTDDNSTVNDAKRFNANNVDLNRNFPDPKDGEHPDGKEWQPETKAMMEFMENRHFNLSMNFHGGAEVLNYPWDTFSQRHADNGWFIYISREYVDTVHAVDAGYMTDKNNGITNGYDWYSVAGGRQDYVTYFLRGREITTELSDVKLVDASELPVFWNKNYKSLLNFIAQAQYGIKGTVVNKDNEPVDAEIFIADYDKDSSSVFTHNGIFYRYLKTGTYNITVKASGYKTKTIPAVDVADKNLTELNIVLDDETSIITELSSDVIIYPNPSEGIITIKSEDIINKSIEISVFDIAGRNVYYAVENNTKSYLNINLNDLIDGIYFLHLKYNNIEVNKKLIINK